MRNALGYKVLNLEQTHKILGESVNFKNISHEEKARVEELLLSFGIETFEHGKEFEGEVVLPDLVGGNIEEHFENISYNQVEEFIEIIEDNLKENNHPLPSKGTLAKFWSEAKPGWTRFQKKGKELEVSNPEGIQEKFVIFDTETFVKGSNFACPVMATAINKDAFYIWLHPALIDGELDYEPMLIDIGETVRVVVCHNVAYDRPRTVQGAHNEPYRIYKPAFWMCTQSMHQLVAGVCEEQIWAVRKTEWEDGERPPYFLKYGTTKSLVAAFNFHCGGSLKQADKKIRNVFVDAEVMQEFRDIIVDLLYYASLDVFYTYRLFNAVYPKYRRQAPSWVHLCADYYLANAVLPVENDWYEWANHVEGYCRILEDEAQEIINKWLDRAYSLDFEDREFDIYWKNLHESRPKDVGIKSDTCHYLFKLSWHGYPVLKDKKFKWSYTDEDGILRKPPHPNGSDDNVGNMFIAKYYKFIEQGVYDSQLSGEGKEDFRRLIEIQHLLGYWISIRKRVFSQPIAVKPHYRTGELSSMLMLGVCPKNTVSSRIGQELWLTVAAHNGKKPGAELKSKVQPPKGYKIISSDFASQELQVLALYSTSYNRISGATPLDNTTIVGTKEDKTDVHTVLGNSVGLSRQEGKSAVYGASYGIGRVKLAQQAGVEEEDSLKLLNYYKGKKDRSSGYFHGGIASQAFNKMQDIINEETPRLPMLGTWIQPALTPRIWQKNGAPGQLNLTVQGSGSLILQCTISAIEYLIDLFQLDARFCFSLHDELVLTCHEEDTDLLAYLYQVAHVWVWGLLHYKLKVYDIPCNRAWIGVNEDVVWRKEYDTETSTPTYRSIPKGHEWTIKELTEKNVGDKIVERANKLDIKVSKV